MDTSQSRITVANLAIQRVAGQLISSFVDGSAEALAVNNFYNPTRDELLAKHKWTFAQKTIALNLLTITPPDFGDGATLVYGYPVDYIKAGLFNIPTALLRFEADGIHSDTPGLVMKYTYANDDPGTYSPEFIEALSLLLASKICIPLSQSAQYKGTIIQEYEMKLQEAISADSQAGTPDQAQANDWLAARLAGSNSVADTTSIGGNVAFGN
jgi:hypothetical protein